MTRPAGDPVAPRTLTVAEVARIASVRPETIRRWLRRGRLKRAAWPGHEIRILETELKRVGIIE